MLEFTKVSQLLANSIGQAVADNNSKYQDRESTVLQLQELAQSWNLPVSLAEADFALPLPKKKPRLARHKHRPLAAPKNEIPE